MLLVTFPCSLILIPCSSRAIPCLPISNSLLFRNRELPSNHLRYRWLPRQKWPDQPQKGPNSLLIPCFSLLLMVASRDRVAPNCAIRHPVWPIVALQRRMRFSARLAGFCKGRWHQRRARRAERASFPVFVSNPDFRVPRLRQIGKRALTGPCSIGKEAARGVQNQGQGYRGVAG